MTLDTFQRRMEKLNLWAQHGCGNHGCTIEKPKGMGANMGCNCRARDFSMHLLELAAEIESTHGPYQWWKKADSKTALND